MTYEEIKELSKANQNLVGTEPEIIETHISWLIIGQQHAYKIKRPVQYPFLDFSSLKQRKHYCDQEIKLNRRLVKDVYLGVKPICIKSDTITLESAEGRIIDYAVKMLALDQDRLMNRLLQKNKVGKNDIHALADQLVIFHKKAEVIYRKDIDDVGDKFRDISNQKPAFSKLIGETAALRIEKAIKASDRFIDLQKKNIEDRHKKGYCKDCHGDLHAGNIFLLDQPVIFDCIEFNPDFRQIDILNEIAFLCMDLEASEHTELSELLMDSYNKSNVIIRHQQDEKLFAYYKSFRANVRAKTSIISAEQATDDVERKQAIHKAGMYLELMESYMD